MRVGFIGLGTMGAPAARLARLTGTRTARRLMEGRVLLPAG